MPGRKPLPVYHPEDVDKLCVRTLTPIVMKTPAVQQKPAPKMSQFIVPVEQKLFLSIKEAAAYSGLPEAYLLRQIKCGAIKAAKIPSWRIKRDELARFEF
jgi:excisionase family DNA binding protein